MVDAKEDELLPKEVGFAIQANNVRYGVIHKPKERQPSTHLGGEDCGKRTRKLTCIKLSLHGRVWWGKEIE